MLAMTLASKGADAQQPGKIYRVGVLVNRKSVSPETETLRAGMAQLGYVEGTNVVYEVRAAEGRPDRLPGFAAELVGKGVDVIVSYGGPPTNSAQKRLHRSRSYLPSSPIPSPSGQRQRLSDPVVTSRGSQTTTRSCPFSRSRC